MVALSFVFGLLLVIPIGAADMPVVIALLNSYGGLADAAMGFVLMNKIQIITGSLDGTSGFLLVAAHVPRHEPLGDERALRRLRQGRRRRTSAAAAEAKGTVRSITAEETAVLFETAQQRHRRARLRHGRGAGAARGRRAGAASSRSAAWT